jgi:hypothetical protein
MSLNNVLGFDAVLIYKVTNILEELAASIFRV